MAKYLKDPLEMEKRRSAIVKMHDYDRMSFRAIGEILGISKTYARTIYNQQRTHRSHTLLHALEDYRTMTGNPKLKKIALEWIKENQELLHSIPGVYYSSRHIHNISIRDTSSTGDWADQYPSPTNYYEDLDEYG
jgi:transposase